MSTKSAVSQQQKQQQLKYISSVVRALVTSRKPPCLLREILMEYPEVESKQLPFRSLGYRCAEELLGDTGEFIISRIGGETCIASKTKPTNCNSANTLNKSHQLTYTKQSRKPTGTDQSWNKSSFSANVFQKLPTSTSRLVSQSRTNVKSGGDRNNNHSAEPPKQRHTSKQQHNHYKKAQDSEVKDLRDMLNINQTQQQQPQLLPQEEQQQPQHKQPRPILGHNNRQQEHTPQYHQRQKVDIIPQYRDRNEQYKINISNYQKLSVQNRLRLKIASNGIDGNNSSSIVGDGNSGGTTPDSSPSISSAGSDQPQQPEFNKRAYKPQCQVTAQQGSFPPKVFQFNPKLDPITSLSQYCIVRRCPQPEYSMIRSKFSRLYQCRIQVNGSIFSTYPNEYPSEHIAKISCAQKAIELITVQEARRPLPPCTGTDEEFIAKLFNELLEHPHGIFAKNMPEWFESKFQEVIPEHWWTLVQTSKKFLAETAASNAVIVFANTESEKEDTGATIIQMDGIKLPWLQKYWELYVTHCASTVEVWARLFGMNYSERLDNLMNDIDIYMLTEKVRPLSIACKQMYLVCISESWHRVRLEEVDKVNGTATCFFIDFGDIDSVAVNQLYYCEQKFLKLPAQAVPFSLFGLEDFAGNPNARRHLDALLPSKSLIAEILTKESEFYNESSSNGKIQVVLYDTSTREDINLNPLLLNQICNDTPPPEIKQKGVTNVVVTHITDEGDVYLQIVSNELKYVQKLIQQLIESKFKHEQHKVTRDDLIRSNIFLICDDDNGGSSAWYRGALTGTQFNSNDEEFDILFVDHGNIKRTQMSKIFRLESLSTALSKFPRQAVRVRLHNIPETSNHVVGRMRALLPPNCEAIVKLVTTGVIPSITIYRRLEGSETLSNVNDVIRIEHELESCSSLKLKDEIIFGPDNDTDSKKNGIKSSSNSSFVDLTRGLIIATSVPNSPQKANVLPKLKNYGIIPTVGNYLEVRVTMSANPSNFVVQPYEEYPRLRDMMKELQDYCENNDEFIPADMVEIGQAYAAKNPDGFYHRVTVVNTYNGEMIHVCFCDFGDIAILRCDQLKILPAKYRQLPKMAIQAKLYGIAARFGDWTLDDCLRFRELTVGQKFCSAIKNISYEDPRNPESEILELELIDVTTDEDVYLHELLLKENRAIPEKPENMKQRLSNQKKVNL